MSESAHSESGPPPLPKQPDAAQPVVLCHARDPFQAELIRGRLAAESIDSFVEGAESYQVLWYIQPAVNPRGLPVMVRRADLEAARRVLADLHDPGEPPPEGRPDIDIMALADAEPAEPPAERSVQRGFWASIICFMSLLGIPLAFYAMWLLWKGRSAWNAPDPATRRRCRRRLVIGWAMCLLMLAAILLFAGVIVEQAVRARVRLEGIQAPMPPSR